MSQRGLKFNSESLIKALKFDLLKLVVVSQDDKKENPIWKSMFLSNAAAVYDARLS